MKNKKLLGNSLLLLTAIIWGTAFVFQRSGMEIIEPLTFNAARMALAAVVIGILAFVMRRKRRDMPEAEQKQTDKNTLKGGMFCGIFLAVASIFQQAGLVYTPAGKAGFITAMYMLLVPVIGFVFLKRKNTWLVWFAVLLGVTGMYFLCITDKFSLSHGDFLVCMCAFVFSFHIIFCDHYVKLADPIGMSAVQFVTATVISVIAAFVFEKPSAEKLISALVPIIYCGIVSGGIGYTLQIVAQKYTDPTVASLLLSMESVFAAIAGALILSERMSVRELIGCAIMLVAVILVQLPGRERGN